MLALIGVLAAAAWLTPRLGRRDIAFGVTVAADFRDGPAGRRIARRYALEIGLFAALAAAIVLTDPMPRPSGFMLLGQTLAAGLAFERARRAVRPYAVVPAAIREAEIGPRPGLPGGVAGQLGPFLILLAAAVYVGLHWDAIPARFPTHWNLEGRPNGWTAKSLAGVYRGLGIGFLFCSLMWFTSFAVLRWTRLPRVTGDDGRRARQVRRANLIATLASQYLVALLLAWTSTVGMFADEAAARRLPLAFRVAPFALLLLGTLAIRLLRQETAGPGPPVGDTTPDSAWLFGRLYANRADPALFVARRIGLGYTLNFGNPFAWLVMGVFVSGLAGLLFAV